MVLSWYHRPEGASLNSSAPTLLSAVAVASLLAGCQHAPTIESQKANGANVSPRRVFLWSSLGDARQGKNFGKDFNHAVSARMAEGLKACGVQVAGYDITGLEADTSDFLNEIGAFKPDAVMMLQKTHGTVNSTGSVLIRATFTMSLFDSSKESERIAKHLKDGGSLKAMWRSTVDFRPSDHSFGIRSFKDDGASLADGVADQMKADGFFPDCPKMVKPPPPVESSRTE